MADDEWYRSAAFDDAAREEFARRLKRARHKAQYKRLKATYLIDGGEPEGLAWAEQLLHEVTDDPDSFDRAFAFEELARIYRLQGRLDLALQALNECLELGRNGTSGIPDLTVAEILLERGGDGDLSRAAEILDCSDLHIRLTFKQQRFRFLFAVARTLDRLGRDPGPPARQALAILDDLEPDLPRHPTVGRARASDADREELSRLARR